MTSSRGRSYFSHALLLRPNLRRFGVDVRRFLSKHTQEQQRLYAKWASFSLLCLLRSLESSFKTNKIYFSQGLLNVVREASQTILRFRNSTLEVTILSWHLKCDMKMVSRRKRSEKNTLSASTRPLNQDIMQTE
jgi:hypothetical protein